MTVNELAILIDAELLNNTAGENEVKCGYACDLLSWVMAHGSDGMAWITVQTHMNVIAVASLHEMSCVIIPEDISVEREVLDKAAEEGIAVLGTKLDAYSICGKMAEAGIGAA